MSEYTEFIETIEKVDPGLFTVRNTITRKDRIELNIFLTNGDIMGAIDFYIEKYLSKYSEEYSSTIRQQLLLASQGKFSKHQQRKVEENISLMSDVVATLSLGTVAYMTRRSLDKKDIKKDIPPDLYQLIKNGNIKKFEDRVRDTMGSTSQGIIDSIRNMQSELLTGSLRIEEMKRKGASKKIIDREVKKMREAFKKSLKGEEFDKLINGDIIKSKEYLHKPSGKIVSNRMKLENYLNMSVQTTLLNADRDTEETAAKIKGDEVVEYYLKDNRKVMKHREACKFILNTSVLGKPILAVTPEAASKYDIMTIDEARNFEDGAMGPYCRHSIKPVSTAYMKRLTKEVA